MTTPEIETGVGHTRTPWRYGNTGPDQIMILGGSGAYVCTVQIEQRGGIIAKAMEPERRANAALIVRCVNSYEIMKAALEEIAGDPTNLSSYQADLAKAALSTIQKASE
jgi:hypothetical protein